MPQPGAQNQKATGLWARAAFSEKVVCVPMMFADTSCIDDGATVSEVKGSVVSMTGVDEGVVATS